MLETTVLFIQTEYSHANLSTVSPVPMRDNCKHSAVGDSIPNIDIMQLV